MEAQFAIIGGTGVYDPQILNNPNEITVETPYGEVKAKLGTYIGKNVIFLARHGAKHSVPPHMINYRANIWALKKLGVQRIIATAAVGSLNPGLMPGDVVLVDQFIDFTKNRTQTFFDGDRGVIHIDMTEPYCSDIRRYLKQAAVTLGLEIHDSGTYVCTEGPRFETPAEIRMYKKMGGDVVGMTSVPEVVLAREAEMCYASIGIVTNFAAGISPNPLTHTEVLEMIDQNNEVLRTLAMKSIEFISNERDCRCNNALDELGELTKG